jgi:hypothetical protein
VRTLLNIYTNQHVRVLWNGIYSCNFSVKNGVKQGGIISPVLLCLYFDNVLAKLKSSQVGCYIGNLYVGALAYADDLVLLAPTAASMQVCSLFVMILLRTFTSHSMPPSPRAGT